MGDPMVRTFRRGLFWALGLAGLIWVGAAAFLLIVRVELIYPFADAPLPREITAVPRGAVASLTATDGTALTVWTVTPQPDRPVILFFMGNGANLPSYLPRLKLLAEAGFGVAALNYRGASGADGTPSQGALTDDAVLLYDQLDTLMGQTIPDGRRVAFGVSLGAAIAGQLAAHRPHAAVVLEAPFARLCEAGADQYPLIPVCWLLPDNRWETLSIIDRIDAPLLIQHGDADKIIPFAQGRKLFERAVEPKAFIAYPGGGHANLRRFGAVDDMIRWLDETLRVR